MRIGDKERVRIALPDIVREGVGDRDDLGRAGRRRTARRDLDIQIIRNERECVLTGESREVQGNDRGRHGIRDGDNLDARKGYAEGTRRRAGQYPELGKVKVTGVFAGSAAGNAGATVTCVVVTSVTRTPAGMRPACGLSAMPTTTPEADANVNVVVVLDVAFCAREASG